MKPIENFLERMKNRSSYKIAIPVLLICSLILAGFIELREYLGLSSDEMFKVLEGKEQIIFKDFGFYFLFTVLFLILSSYGSYLFGVLFFKSKAKFKDFLYLYSLAAIVPAVLFLVLLYIPHPAIPYADIIIDLIFLYLHLVVIKSLHRISYLNSFFGVIIGNLFGLISAWIIIILVLKIYAYVFYLNYRLEQDVRFNFNITDNSDGSFTTTYAIISAKTDKLKEVCYLTFPKDWSYENQTILKKIYYLEWEEIPDWNITYSVFYKTPFNGITPEYFMFRGAPPIGQDKNLLKSAKESYEEDPEPLQESVILRTMSPTETEILDIKIVNVSGDITRHIVYVSSPTEFGYPVGYSDAIYQAPYGKDQDIEYILNSSICYKYP